jgi:hypothetical protein
MRRRTSLAGCSKLALVVQPNKSTPRRRARTRS